MKYVLSLLCFSFSLMAMQPKGEKKNMISPRNKSHKDSPLLKKKKNKKSKSTLETIHKKQEQMQVELDKMQKDLHSLSTNFNKLLDLTTIIATKLKADSGYDADIENSEG